MYVIETCQFTCIIFLTVPDPVVEVTNTDAVEFGKTTTLECNATAVREITSGISIYWLHFTLFNFTIVRIVDNVTANIVGNSAVYTDQITTPPLSVNDSGTGYGCYVIINSTGEFYFDIFILNLTGKQQYVLQHT